MSEACLVFPHQLFESSPLFDFKGPFFIIEEDTFFHGQSFHKQKICFHRASMRKYHDDIRKKRKLDVHYIPSTQEESDIAKLVAFLKEQQVSHVHYIDPVDHTLKRKLQASLHDHGLTHKELVSPLFINNKNDLSLFFRKDKKKFHQTSFYKEQRKKLNILLDDQGQPLGGKWTYDVDNRKKYPSKRSPPKIKHPKQDDYHREALEYVREHFSSNRGELCPSPIFPTDHQSTKLWLIQFLEERFHDFGAYEDAIVNDSKYLHHSVLSPMMNIGLITPQEVIRECLSYARSNDIPINSTEGFIRQIIGWREFIRGMYEFRACDERGSNFWNFKRDIPKSFYTGTTGIEPVDATIQKVLKTGYAHHIERLMVLGNIMMLCEFHPDAVYQWFMEMFIDAYDWVMVTNIYGMSQFADGGMMSTKPYISGSNYLLKMSNFKKGPWQKTWDGLFWRFMNSHRDFFLSNPRLGMLIRTFDKMDETKQKHHLQHAQQFLNTLS
jgi:deoxyribodipyrimidine photolyase-related protein